MPYRKYGKKYGRKRVVRKRKFAGKRRMFKKMRQYAKSDGYHAAKLVQYFPLKVDIAGGNPTKAYIAFNWSATQLDLVNAGFYDASYCHTFDSDSTGGGLNPEI